MKKLLVLLMVSLLLLPNNANAVSIFYDKDKESILNLFCLSGDCLNAGGSGSLVGAGNVSQLNQGNGIVLTPNPITNTGTVSLNDSYVSQSFVSRSDWGTHDNYPLSCTSTYGAGYAVVGLGDSLECAQFLTSAYASNTVSDERQWGLSPDAGTSPNFSRADHTHGTTNNPVDDGAGNRIVWDGITWNIFIGDIRVAFIDSFGDLHIKGTIITEDEFV